MLFRSTLFPSHDIMLDVGIVEGSFNDVYDVMKYIEYRLNLRGRDTDSISLDNICLLSETTLNDQLEVKL